ncbi:hypothetical protein GTY65_33395 [Streptomyces sp. SID8379]|uniref:hypothetical protein n=1 Tax=unclassified Streptomyces TaxID=2593676 RepID=UPI00039B556D|nr:MULTISPECIES: hypothetical protein [unclassified Streptomyces]MYW68934.1 hypothetical protein [Streptomyces sp. SID8379]
MRRLLAGRRGRAGAAIAVGVALCGSVALPGAAAAAGTGADDPYVFAEGAHDVRGAPRRSTDAPRLKTGEMYRSSLGAGASGTAYFRVALDGAANAYASVVAVPPLGSGVKAASSDGVTVTLQDQGGDQCDSGNATFRSGAYPRPIAAVAERLVRPGGARCQQAGTYYVVVERKTGAGSTGGTWGLELKVATEPGLVTPAPTQGPQSWSSASVQPPSGAGTRRSGGTGFNDARALPSGVWKDRVGPGQSHFYRVPVDWGQQLSVDAELAGSEQGASSGGTVPGALDMELYNPARAPVTAEDVLYTGDPASTTFDPLPPVAYENRYVSRDGQAAMRLAGWYYLKVTVSPTMARKFRDEASDVTLRVTVAGDAAQAPDYVRDAGEFQVTSEDLAAAEKGEGGAVWKDTDAKGSASAGGSAGGGAEGESPGAGSGSGSGSSSGSASASAGSSAASSSTSSGSAAMTLLGVTGIGTGTALLLWLGVWRVVAVRRVRVRVQVRARG